MKKRILLLVIALIATLAVNADPVKQKITSMVYLVEIENEETGSEACYREQMSCLSVTTAKLFDNENNFYGFVTPTCDSQVIKKEECEKDFNSDYAIDNVVFKKSPKAKSSQTLAADYFCLSSEHGKRGKYRYVYCVKR